MAPHLWLKGAPPASAVRLRWLAARFTAYYGLPVRDRCPIVLPVFVLPLFYFW